VHANKLGRIAFRPNSAVAYTQDPGTWHDYLNQIRRWTLGYWQTVRRHGMRQVGRFWVVLAVQVIELITSSVVVLLMVPSILFTVYCQTLADRYGYLTIAGLEVVGSLAPHYVTFGFVIPDLALTVFAAIALRRPSLLLFAPLFPFMRLVDAYICLRAIPPSRWRTQSTGRWISPTRRKASPHSLIGQHRPPLTAVPRIEERAS
jgi:poly-beta-1,6-N-acetyl-D-glucosamine synthase